MATRVSTSSASRATSSAVRNRVRAEEIETFCSTTYGVTFPMMEKIEVNGPNRHPIYAELTAVADAEGHDGDIRWNFEKFLVGKDGSITRFAPMVEPQDPAVVAAIEAELG